jgi:outer membrane protein W
MVLCGQSFAEDTKGKWQFGFGISYFSTTDYIRSNADLAFASGTIGPTGLPSVGNVDPRPDINILNQPSVADRFQFDAKASYGLTRWLAVEVSGSYLKSPVGNIEFFTENNTQPLGFPTSGPAGCGPVGGQTCFSYTPGLQESQSTNTFLPVGEITEIPIRLDGLIRFRPESPFDPYIGLGVGYMFNSLSEGSEFKARSTEVSNLLVSTASEGEFTDPGRTDKPAGGSGPAFHPAPLEATLGNSFEWHAIGGVDYYINDHFSFYIDARYVWTSGAIDIRTDGAHQVEFGILDQGQLLLGQLGSPTDPSQYNLWEDQQPFHHYAEDGTISSLAADCHYQNSNGQNVSCLGDRLFETEDKNNNEIVDQDLFLNPVTHFTQGELTRCYPGQDPDTIKGEDDGCIFVFPPGPYNGPGDRFTDLTFKCPSCVGNNPPGSDPNVAIRPDTEDRNFNNYMDRFLLYGIDICTTQAGVGNPACAHSNTHFNPDLPANYVWPGGCSTVAPTSRTPPVKTEGCPEPFVSASSAPSTTSTTDDVADSYLIQGGKIFLGGFGLGFGFKFTF